MKEQPPKFPFSLGDATHGKSVTFGHHCILNTKGAKLVVEVEDSPNLWSRPVQSYNTLPSKRNATLGSGAPMTPISGKKLLKGGVSSISSQPVNLPIDIISNHNDRETFQQVVCL